jgi:cytochrome b
MVKVWDVFVRFSHWAVALGFFVAYLTEDDLLTLHVWAGYAVGLLVVLRLLWGFVGPKHARFTDFLYGPRTVIAYLGSLIAFRAKRHIGHSPPGGAMAIVLWLALLAIVWTGLEVYAIEEGRGPLAAVGAEAVPAHADLLVLVNEDDDNDDDKERDKEGRKAAKLWEKFHESISDVVLLLVVVHVGAVGLASLVHRENLVRSMLTGRKRAE